MSVQGDITFNIYYDGKFKTDGANKVSYEGGRAQILEAPAVSLYTCMGTELPISLFNQRMWYKQPYEDLSELNVLFNGGETFERMCISASWTGAVDVYLEHENVHDTDEDDEAMGNTVAMGNTEAMGNTDATENVESTTEAMGNADATENDEASGTFICEEEARVEAIVSRIHDDDDEDDTNAYQKTPPQSDCEDEESDMYERWIRGSGELKIRQLFESVTEFKEAVLEYALKGGWNVRFSRWGKVKSEAVCAIEGGDMPCPWRVYCSYDDGTNKWMVKTLQDQHTCFPDGHCRILSDSYIAKLFLNDVRDDPFCKAKFIQRQIEERYGVCASYDQCRKAKTKALNMIQAEYDEEYRRIKDYETETNELNPRSTTKLVTVDAGEGQHVFERFYVCF